jgi:hypothetical protein
MKVVSSRKDTCPAMLLLLRLEDSSSNKSIMISRCHYSVLASHRDREPICFGVQRSKISGARKRMCRNPCCNITCTPFHTVNQGVSRAANGLMSSLPLLKLY